MSIGQWTKILTEDGLTKTPSGQYVQCRAEIAAPTSDWENVWRISRLQGLGSESISFNFKLLHKLLISRKGLQRLNPDIASTCQHCSNDLEDDLEHSLIHCSFNNEIGVKTLEIVRRHTTCSQPNALLRLELGEIPEESELPLVSLISVILKLTWDKRLRVIRPTLYDVRCSLEARCQILRESRYQKAADVLNNMSQLF